MLLCFVDCVFFRTRTSALDHGNIVFLSSQYWIDIDGSIHLVISNHLFGWHQLVILVQWLKNEPMIHPQNLTWKLGMMVFRTNVLFQWLIFRFHVECQGWVYLHLEVKTCNVIAKTEGKRKKNATLDWTRKSSSCRLSSTILGNSSWIKVMLSKNMCI